MVNVLETFVPEFAEDTLLVVDIFDMPEKTMLPPNEEMFVDPSRDKIVVGAFSEVPDDPLAATEKSIFEEALPVDDEVMANVPPLFVFALAAAMAVPEIEIFVFGIEV